MSWLDLVLMGGAVTSLAGQVTGTTAASVVSFIGAVATPGVGPSAGQYYRASSPTVAAWSSIAGGDLPTLTGDVLWNTAPGTKVVGIGSGGTVTVPVHCTNLTFDAGAGRVVNVAQSSSGAGDSISVLGGAAKTGSAAAGGNAIVGGGAGDGAGAGGAVQFKTGAVTLGTFTTNASIEWALTSDGSRAGIRIDSSAGGVGSYIFLRSVGTNGAIYSDTSVWHFRDVTANDVVAWALASTGPSSWTLAAACALTWQQTAPSIDTAPNDWVTKPSRAFASATGANRKAADYVVDVGAPTNSGTAEARLTVKRAGAVSAALGPYEGSGSANAALYLQVTPSGTNYAAFSDGTSLHLNSPGGGTLFFEIGGSATAFFNTSGFKFWETVTAPVFGHGDRTTDAATNILKLVGQSAYASSTGTNQNGAIVEVQGGSPKTAGSAGLRGGVRLALNKGILGGDYGMEWLEIALNQRILGLVTGTNLLTTGQVPSACGDGVIWVAEAATSPTDGSASGKPTTGALLWVDATTGELRMCNRFGTVKTLG